jgi:cell division septal protein FtsQ
MSGNAFGGYNKPNFEVKNLTSDMWEPISTTNNFSAYTPEKNAAKSQNSFNGTRQTQQTKSEPVPAKQAPAKKKVPTKKDSSAVKNKKIYFKAKENTKTRQKAKANEKAKPQTQERPISSGRVPQPTKNKNNKAPTKRQINLREKRRQKINQAYIRLIKKGKTADQARVILTKRKIRLKRIKTFGTVVFFFLFALSFMLSFSYYQGAEIAEIIIKNDGVYTDLEILQAAQLEKGMNMLTVREKKVNDDVTKELPFISEIGVDYRLPDTLALDIISTKEQLILKCEKKYICVDKTGKVVSDKKKKLAEGQFLVQGLVEQEYVVGEPFEVSEENAVRYKIACEFAKATEEAATLNYGVLDLKDLKDITFTYRSKIRLYLGDGSNLATKLDNAIRIMDSSDIGDKTGYINLKYDIGAYFMEGSMK